MKSCSMAGCMHGFIVKMIGWFDRLSPLIDLTARLWMANVFWKSGILKISDWNNTLYLFTNEFPVPGMPPFLAAVFGTTFELACPVLLTLGLASRFATVPLLVMTAVINFTYDDNIQHYYWAMLLAFILLHGPGKISLDHWIKQRFGSLPRKR
ncbi:MAG: DoxX family protein [Pseudomonadota bacterium]|nr:DoxX family protein [Pseudomonadota bacterium]